MTTNRQAWTALSTAAIAYATDPHNSRAMSALEKAARDWVAAQKPAQAQGDGPVFPPYGRSKGLPVRGATAADLEFYANGCRRTLADESKARWHDKERALLAAIEAEQRRQGVAEADIEQPF